MNDSAPDDRYRAVDELAEQKADQSRMVPAFTVHPPPPSLFHGVIQVYQPRNESEIRAEIKASAAAAGDDWYYRIPFRNKDGTTTYVEGPSKSLANAVLRLYKYAEVDGWISGEGPDFVEFTARFIDTERGVAMTRVFRQRKGAAKVGTDKGRNDEITFAIGMTKAIRNVVCNALEDLCNFAFEEAKKSIVDRIGKNLDDFRRRVLERLQGKVDLKRVEAIVGRPSKEWLAPDIAMIIERMKGVEEGMALMDQVFPPIVKETASTAPALDKMAEKPAEPDPKVK